MGRKQTLEVQKLSPAIRSWLQESHYNVEKLPIEPLAGDASNRSYFRLRNSDASHSSILMQLNTIDRRIQSEEIALSYEHFHELPFVNIHRHLQRCHIPVPEIYIDDSASGYLLLQDLGNTLFLQRVEGADTPTQWDSYRSAIDELIKIQAHASHPPRGEKCYAFQNTFNEKLFLWEFHHFEEYLMQKGRQIEIEEKDKSILEEGFSQISQKLSRQPRCFVHRDYHSRNLIFHDNHLWILDFQDALLGPYTYDLASLLRDPYHSIEEPQFHELVEYYLKKISKKVVLDSDSFREVLYLSIFQRNLKAAGRFHYIDQVKHNPNYLQYVPRALAYARESLQKLKGLNRFRKVIGRLLPELGG